MKTKISIICFLIFLIGFNSLFAQEQINIEGFNDTMIGITTGTYAFDKEDEIREAYNEVDNESKNEDRYGGIWVELYLNDYFGVGYRSINIGRSNTVVDDTNESQVEETTREIKISSALTTIQLMLLVSSSKQYKLGTIGGSGKGTYTIETKKSTPDGGQTTTDSTYRTTGNIRMLGLFFQFRGENWGGRLGYYIFQTDFENITVAGQEYEADGSGKANALDIFYAF